MIILNVLNSKNLKILIVCSLLIGLLIYGGNLMIDHLFENMVSECGYNDGPYSAKINDTYSFSGPIEVIDTFSFGVLIIEHGLDSTPPILGFINGMDTFLVLDLNLGLQSGHYQYGQIFKIKNVSGEFGNELLQLVFRSTYKGGKAWEIGYMDINIKDGSNSICLDW